MNDKFNFNFRNFPTISERPSYTKTYDCGYIATIRYSDMQFPNLFMPRCHAKW